MHNKRSEMPKQWPIARKGTAYYGRASHNSNKSIPVTMAIRDILKFAKTRKEVREMRKNKEIKVNGKIIVDDKYPIGLFDILSLDKEKKNYQLVVTGKKYTFEEISEKDSHEKIVKICGKVNLPKKKVQMNLEDGTNFLSSEKFSLGDSVVIDLKNRKPSKIIRLMEGAKVRIVAGKHTGEEGTITEIVSSGKKKEYSIKIKDKEVVLPLKTILAIK